VELTVSLVAGLVVALAVAGLSREATRTFNEEVRISSAEASLRSAVDRLRADLQRAGYMSTANIQSDPMIAKAPGQPNVVVTATNAGLQRLAGIRLFAGSAGQTATNGLTLSTVNNLAPAMIEIGGNLTTAEQFEVQTIQPAAVGACTQIQLAATSPAIFRILNPNDAGVNDANGDTEMRNLFQPVPAGSSANQFIVRVVDDTGRSQFLLTCKNQAQVAGLFSPLTPTVLSPYVLVDSAPLTAAQTQGIGGVVGNAAGRAWVNPVHVVRWEIVGQAPGNSGDPEPAQAAVLAGTPLTPNTADPNKYDLMRSFVDAAGTVIAATSEIVAEYAVDLDFAFSVDTGDTTGTASAITTYAFGDANNATVAPDVSSKPPTAGPTAPDPQRIRSVRLRLVTRSPQPDRTVPLAANAPFLYRYCLNSSNCPPTPAAAVGAAPQWARARTIVTEVSLPNQSLTFF
jgi:hypothetical protein